MTPGLADTWLAIAQRAGLAQQKLAAIRLTAEAGDVSFRPHLTMLLDDASPEVRARALKALVLELGLSDADIENRCWQLLVNDLDEDVRSRAALSLGRIFSIRPSLVGFDRLRRRLEPEGEQARMPKLAILDALFRIAGMPPLEWPGSRPRDHVLDTNIPASRLDELRERVALLSGPHH